MSITQQTLDEWWVELQSFSSTFEWSPIVKVMRDDWLPFMVSGRGSPTPMFVIGSSIFVATTLMSGKEFRGNTFDLPTFGHEAYHVQQFHRKGWWWLFIQYIRGVVMSYSKKRILWDHASIPMEVEAMRIEMILRDSEALKKELRK